MRETGEKNKQKRTSERKKEERRNKSKRKRGGRRKESGETMKNNEINERGIGMKRKRTDTDETQSVGGKRLAWKFLQHPALKQRVHSSFQCYHKHWFAISYHSAALLVNCAATRESHLIPIHDLP